VWRGTEIALLQERRRTEIDLLQERHDAWRRTEIALLQERHEKMTKIIARMQEAKANREYHKMPDLKREQDAAMGR
jgi:hypothetical protein